MDSLKGMFGQPEWSLRHETVKYIYTKRMKEGTSVREHVLDMKMHFNIAEVNGGAINEQFQNLTKGKGKEVEANVTTTKGKFKRGSSSRSKTGPSKPNRKIEKKGKGKTPKQNKETSSWKRLSEGEITLKVGTGEMVSAKAVGDLKIGRLVKIGLLNQLEDNFLPSSDSCLKGKMTKRSFTGKGFRAKTPLELVHSNLCGPMNVKAREGYEYFISFIDDYSRYGHVYLIQNKSNSFEKFKEYKTEVENESGGLYDNLTTILGLSEAQFIIPDDGIEDPLTFKQAMNDVDSDQWIKAMDLEMESMYSNSVWTLVDQPNDVRPIGCKWIYKRKRDQAGKVQTLKARLVAKGYTQKKGINYEETFSPLAMIKSIRILLSIATSYDYEIWQMDVKTAFLNGNLEESIYMVQPEGFTQKDQE
ncbi:gag/pol protein [Cucumis melo var. makuwa]|uniref:Gag/pol protein n=1 Tax=Cucumis melo var. makuwa TaxID=1194695 RepID=A0A5A7THZ6_CUCMM|nr:gag/pol protein [Cucumis melo var. makuwa]